MENKPTSCPYGGWSSKCLSGAPSTHSKPMDTGHSSHGNFAGYHQRSGHPPEAAKICACGQVVRRRHLGESPNCHLGQSRCSRLDSRAFDTSFTLYSRCANQLRRWRDPRSADTRTTSLLDLRHVSTLLHLQQEQTKMTSQNH